MEPTIVFICVALFVLYWALSSLLLRHPYLLHGDPFSPKNLLRYPRMCRDGRPLQLRHGSHRGGSAENIENTMAAFRHAARDLHTDILELDCQLSRDGRVVVAHDNSIERLTGRRALFAELNFSELPPLLPRVPIDFLAGQYCTAASALKNARADDEPQSQSGLQADGDCDGEHSRQPSDARLADDRRYCTLEEVFEAFPNMPISVDVKVNDDRLVRAVSDLIERYDRRYITVWGNKFASITENCWRTNPRIPLFLCISTIVRLLLLYYTGLLPFVPIREAFYAPPFYAKYAFDRCGADVRGVLLFLTRVADRLIQSPRLLRHLRARGVVVAFWVLNDEREFERALALDAGIITDRPTRLRAFLQQHDERLRRPAHADADTHSASASASASDSDSGSDRETRTRTAHNDDLQLRLQRQRPHAQ